MLGKIPSPRQSCFPPPCPTLSLLNRRTRSPSPEARRATGGPVPCRPALRYAYRPPLPASAPPCLRPSLPLPLPLLAPHRHAPVIPNKASAPRGEPAPPCLWGCFPWLHSRRGPGPTMLSHHHNSWREHTFAHTLTRRPVTPPYHVPPPPPLRSRLGLDRGGRVPARAPAVWRRRGLQGAVGGGARPPRPRVAGPAVAGMAGPRTRAAVLGGEHARTACGPLRYWRRQRPTSPDHPGRGAAPARHCGRLRRSRRRCCAGRRARPWCRAGGP